MFEIGWTEMLVIAIVMIVIVGPKDLPKMLRTFGKTVAKLRGMAGDFQKQFNEALKEAELDGVKKSLDEVRGLNPMNEIKKQLNPFEKAAADVRAGLDKAMKPSTAAEPAAPGLHPAEPLKAGTAAMPGVAAPEAVPAPPPELVSATPVPVSGPVAAPAASTPTAAKKARVAKPAAPSTESPAAAKPAARKAASSRSPVAAAPEQAPAQAVAAAKSAPAKPAAAKPAAAPPATAASTKTKPPAASKAKPSAANGVNRSGTAK